jgi:hypothetical protein
MRDSGRRAGFDHVRSGAVELAAGQNFVIEFGAGEGFSWNEEMRNPEEPP